MDQELSPALSSDHNPIFDIAFRLVKQGSSNLFVTGKAGTGKTTFLKHVRQHCGKQLVVVAPTGVAAINAGGVTIHSFFQLPLAAFVPEGPGFTRDRDEFINGYMLLSRQRLDAEKRGVMQELELLIIDEISMVRADTLDMIDAVLRHVRNRPDHPFGGVQVLFIGDLYQLPPVMRDDTWSALQEFYASPFFFDCRGLKGHPPLYIEFEKVYRQSDQAFIDLLNQIRHNALDSKGIALLDARLDPGFHAPAGEGFITLSTHNDSVRQINERELLLLDGEAVSFDAEISGDFPDNAAPADRVLQLKKGCQVMFIKNDPDRAKRYYNGKIGTVVSISDDEVVVGFGDGSEELKIRREKWENIRYSVNDNTRSVEEEVMGSYSQFPLRLAWAITVHKSQGLTFQKVIIDAARSFVPGQAYVALSRCTSLDGLVLTSRIRSGSLSADPRITRFAAQRADIDRLHAALLASSAAYSREVLMETFDFRQIITQLTTALDDLRSQPAFEAEAIPWFEARRMQFEGMQQTAVKFQEWLSAGFSVGEPDYVAIAARIRSASGYFVKLCDEQLEQARDCGVRTGNRMHAKILNDRIRPLFTAISLKRWLLDASTGIPDADEFHERRRTFRATAFNFNAFRATGNLAGAEPGDLSHPRLYGELRARRDHIAFVGKLPVYMVANARTLEQLCRFLPTTTADLERITGFGANRAERFGTEFLEIIAAYCQLHGLASAMHELPETSRRRRKTDT